MLYSLAMLTACSGIKESKSPPTQKISVTPPLTFTPAPPSATTTDTPLPTEANAPTLLPTNTLVAIPQAYKFPLWMTRPETKLLMGISDWLEGVFQLSFFNAQTTERFDLPLPQEVIGFFWLDNDHFAFITQDGQSIYSISLLKGEVTEYPVSKNVMKGFTGWDTNTPQAFVAVGGFPDKSGFFLINSLARGSLLSPVFSPNGRYLATSDMTQDGYPITVTTLQTGETTKFNSLNSGLWNTGFGWSPGNSNHLVVFQGKPSPETAGVETDRVKIYDVNTGQFIGYTDKFENSSDQWPCVFDWDTAETVCLPEIAEAHLTGKYVEEEISHPTWSSDKKRVFYTYSYYDLSIEDDYLGNFCIFTLNSKEIFCPTEGLPELKGNTIVTYKISPDEHSVIIHFECRMLGEDYSCYPMSGLINLDGSGFRLLINPELVSKEGMGKVKFILESFMDGTSAYLWRPNP